MYILSCIPVTGVSADQVTNFEVKILILEDSYQELVTENDIIKSPFRPGMSATVEIQTETANDIITVPIQAVTTRADTIAEEESDEESNEEEQEVAKEDEELKECVFLFEDGKAKFQEVKTGIQDNMYIQITEGIEIDQELIVGPYRAVSKKLNDGDDVKKVDKKDLFEKD